MFIKSKSRGFSTGCCLLSQDRQSAMPCAKAKQAHVRARESLPAPLYLPPQQDVRQRHHLRMGIWVIISYQVTLPPSAATLWNPSLWPSPDSASALTAEGHACRLAPTPLVNEWKLARLGQQYRDRLGQMTVLYMTPSTPTCCYVVYLSSFKTQWVWMIPFSFNSTITLHKERHVCFSVSYHCFG